MRVRFRNEHLPGEAFFWEGGPVGILLSHGYTATTAEVRPLAEFLHAQGYTVAGPLLPGHGTTPEEMNRCTWRDWYAAIERAYEDLKARCRQVVVGGESMGGVLTLYLASRHPEVAAVLLYAPAMRVADPVGRLLGPVIWPFLPFVAKGPMDPNIVADTRWKGYEVNPVHALAEMLALERATWPRVKYVTQPLLLVQGRFDRAVDTRANEKLFQRVGSKVKEFHWMERSTHCVMLDQELEEVKAITLAFLKRCGL